MSMDPWLILQVIAVLIFSNAAKKGTPSGGQVLLLLASWIAPIFILGLLKAILVWVLSMFVAMVIIAIKEALFGEKKSAVNSAHRKPRKTKHTEPGSQNKKSESHIIRCPTCQKKISVEVPLRGKKAKCSACLSSFRIQLDQNGNPKVDTEKTDHTARRSHESTSVSDHYRTLGVDPGVTPDEVRAAYKRKIREYHPDRVEGLGDKLKKIANEESIAINAAYSVLKSKGLAT